MKRPRKPLAAASVLALALLAGDGAAASEATPIVVRASGRTFAAAVEDTATGRAFLDLLPLTLDMAELNGNEKYRYGVSLPTAAQHCDTVAAGDLMLYGSNCLVLFYGPAGGYSYTRVGRLLSTDGLAEALGTGTATVTFEKVRLEVGFRPDATPPVFAADTNLPAGTPVTVQGTAELVDGAADWHDVDPSDPGLLDRYAFFRLKAEL